MAILAYDDVMLREPRLLVPRMAPIGNVVLNRSALTQNITRICCPTRSWTKGKGYREPTFTSAVMVGSPRGLSYVGTATNGLITFDTDASFPDTQNYAIGLFGRFATKATRAYIFNTWPGSGSQISVAINCSVPLADSSGSFGFLGYENSIVEYRHYAYASGAVDGGWHSYLCLLNQGTPSIIRDGVPLTLAGSKNATGAVVSAGFGYYIGAPFVSRMPTTEADNLLVVVWSPPPSGADGIAWTLDPFSIFISA